MVVRDIQESQKGMACVTCIACITCMACIRRNAAQYGRRCRIERELATRSPWAYKDGRLLENRMEARVWRGNLGSVASETLCDMTLALQSLSLSWRFADPTRTPGVFH